ncbi:MAG: glycosyltransferase [Flavobacteriales bacterium]
MAQLRVLVLLPYPVGHAPSQRFRIEHFLGDLRSIAQVDIDSFLDEDGWAILYKPRHYLAKVYSIARGFVRRYALLASVRRYDAIWVHRETAPLGWPLYGWLLTKAFKRKVFFEFDDAIWMPNVSHSNRLFAVIKPYRNARFMMRSAHCNVAGNAWLAEFARQLNPSTVCIPTVVDTENVHNRLQNQAIDDPVIGWTGSHSTLDYIEALVPLLEEVYRIQRFKLRVISDRKPTFEFPELDYVQWSAASEGDDLLGMHIGLMPLPDADWARGKCGLKLIQYMAMGIVPVASAVGVNPEIVSQGSNGYLCHTPEEWKTALLRLLTEHKHRQALASNCRSAVMNRYSVESQRHKFLHLFTELHP